MGCYTILDWFYHLWSLQTYFWQQASQWQLVRPSGVPSWSMASWSSASCHDVLGGISCNEFALHVGKSYVGSSDGTPETENRWRKHGMIQVSKERPFTYPHIGFKPLIYICLGVDLRWGSQSAWGDLALNHNILDHTCVITTIYMVCRQGSVGALLPHRFLPILRLSFQPLLSHKAVWLKMRCCKTVTTT